MFSSEVDNGSLSTLIIANRLTLAGAFAGHNPIESYDPRATRLGRVNDPVRADLLPRKCWQKHIVREPIPKADGEIRQGHRRSREEDLDCHVSRHEFRDYAVLTVGYVVDFRSSVHCENTMVVFKELKSTPLAFRL